MNWETYPVYASVVGGAGLLVCWWLMRRIRKIETNLSERVERLKRFEAVGTDSPLEDPAGEARARGLESIATRFSLMRRTILPFVIAVTMGLLALPLLGVVPVAYVSIVAAVVAVVAGIAARPLFENLFAGIVISLSQPIRVGDTVLIDGNYGTVEDISVTHTTIKIWDWRRFMVPNTYMLGHEFINYSLVDRFQWAHVEFWVEPEADLDRVREIAVAAPRASRQYANYEDPRFWIMEMGKEGIRCWVAAWANTPSAAWTLKHDIRTELCRQLQAAGIRTHIYRHALDTAPALPPAEKPESSAFDESSYQS